jgi:hypothetical protein
LPIRASITIGEFGRGYRQWAFAGFVQDAWRATPKLTVNLGLRYEFNRPWTEVNGKLTNLVPGGSLEVVGGSALKNFFEPDRNNFGPRVGLAYDLSGDGKTVIRTGFGIVYETLLQANSVQVVENNPPFSLPAVARLPAPFSPTGAPSTTLLDLRTSARPSRAIAAVGVDDFRNPYMMQTNLSIQRMLSPQLLMEIGYAGTRGVRLPVFRDLNQVPLERLTSAQRALIATEINGIISLQTGQPFTPFVNTLDPYRNESFNRPNLIGDPNENVPDGYAFNPAAFQLAPRGTFGNAGRNIVRGDGFQSVDLSLFKNIRITERIGLQMRFESVNGFNQTNFQAPVTNLAANAGLYIAAAQPRILQLGCKLSF